MSGYYIKDVSPFPAYPQTRLLVHSASHDAKPVVIESMQQAYHEKIFDTESDEFALLGHYLLNFGCVMIVCGVSNLGAALDQFGASVDSVIPAISQLTPEQICEAVSVLEMKRHCILVSGTSADGARAPD